MLRIIEENGVDLNISGMIEKQSLQEFNETLAELLHWDDQSDLEPGQLQPASWLP